LEGLEILQTISEKV